MKKILEVLTSPVWWVSVVIAGILINLVSSYLKGIIDTHLSRFSAARREQGERKRAERKTAVEQLRKNEHQEVMATLAEMRHRLRAIFYLLGGVFFMGWGSILPGVTDAVIIAKAVTIFAFAFGGISLYISFTYFKRAVNVKGLLLEAHPWQDGPKELSPLP
ncbi:MAG: hypothetical protein CV087_20185 [Candidatus Brocadia sp. WS118]|nr:MAG: hypothetical protein CV087_20185 [Candidatus Brocadia sp. WS118]